MYRRSAVFLLHEGQPWTSVPGLGRGIAYFVSKMPGDKRSVVTGRGVKPSDARFTVGHPIPDRPAPKGLYGGS